MTTNTLTTSVPPRRARSIVPFQSIDPAGSGYYLHRLRVGPRGGVMIMVVLGFLLLASATKGTGIVVGGGTLAWLSTNHGRKHTSDFLVRLFLRR